MVLGPLAALVITAAALTARFGERGAQTRYSLLRSRSAAARRKAHYVLDTGSGPAAAKEIRVLGTLRWWRERGQRDSGAYLRPLWRARRRIRLVPFAVYSLVVLAGVLAVLVMLRDTADRGGLSVPAPVAGPAGGPHLAACRGVLPGGRWPDPGWHAGP